MNFIYLASKSISRQMLLKQAGIQFKLIDQSADESVASKKLSLQEVVSNIALKKIEHSILLNGVDEGEVAFVLSADTMGSNNSGEIFGKPGSKDAAIKMLQSYRAGAETITAFYLDKRIWKSGVWQLEKRVQNFAGAKYIFDVPENEVERYFDLSIEAGINYMNVSGAVAIEEFGAQYLKSISGSYTAVVGLPLYEVKEALIDLNFKF